MFLFLLSQMLVNIYANTLHSQCYIVYPTIYN